jgi:hypothetical protein
MAEITPYWTPDELEPAYTELRDEELIATKIGGESGLDALYELELRGVTPENLAKLREEIRAGLTVLERVAKRRGVELPHVGREQRTVQ